MVKCQEEAMAGSAVSTNGCLYMLQSQGELVNHQGFGDDKTSSIDTRGEETLKAAVALALLGHCCEIT